MHILFQHFAWYGEMLILWFLTGLTLFVSPQSPATSPETDAPAESTKPSTPERGFLMRSLDGTTAGCWLDQQKISISGWSDLSFTGSTAQSNQLPMGFNYLDNEFLLQQNWLRIEQPIDSNATVPTYGFRSDTIVPGSDYRFTVARGLWDGQLTANNGQPNIYGFDPVQFYGQAYLPDIGKGLDIKFGRFFAQFGIESIDSTANQLASRSYTFIYNPFTNTGLVTTLKLSDDWSVQNGMVTGSDIFIDPAATPTYLGSIKWAPKDGPASALLSVILGCGQYDVSQQFNNPQIFDLDLTYKLSDKLNWSGELLYGFQNNVPNVGFANWFSVVNYLTYQFADNLSGTTRLEFFDDYQGQRTGYAGLYTAATAGINYKPKSWLWIRPEVRLDYNEAHPFEGKSTLLTAALDVVVKW